MSDSCKLSKAVLLVTFNRLDYLKEVFAAVAKAKPPRLYIASDGPRQEKVGEKEKVDEIRKWLLDHVDWPCEVKTRFLEKNSGGCGPGVSGAVTWFFQNEKDGIILEDDCVPSQTFFRYCEECLDRYADDKRVWHVAGYASIEYPDDESYYFGKVMMCWGWAGWADRWRHFSLRFENVSALVAKSISPRRVVREYWRNIARRGVHGEIETWDYQWALKIMLNGGLCVIPAQNLVSNIGDVGVHYSNAAGQREHKRTNELEQIKHPNAVVLNENRAEELFDLILGRSSRGLLLVKLILKNRLPYRILNSLLLCNRFIKNRK